MITPLYFSYGDRLFLANLDAAFATDAIFGVDGNGYLVFQFEDLFRANIDAFTAADTFFGIYFDVVHDDTPSFGIKRWG
jgi:hypothetical protein